MRVLSRGVTLIDAITGTALMLVVFVGIAGAFHLSLEVIINNKARAGAIALANERMEYIRSLAYASVGTVNGVPAGTITQIETSTLNGTLYSRRTFITYGDDPKDGVGAADTNGIQTDYKSVKIEVSWSTKQGTREVQILTRITPTTGTETNTGGGTLVVNATNATGAIIPGATVRMVNTANAVDVTTYTNASGTATLVGAPAGAGYQIFVSQAGLSSAQTYSTSATNTSPNPSNASVTTGNTTAATFSIDSLGSITVQTFGFSGTTTIAQPNVSFRLHGAKTIGSGPSGTIYKYDQTHSTGAGASITIPSLEWDSYTVALTGATYDIASSCPAPQPESLSPGASLSESIYVRPHTTNSLLVDVNSAGSGALLQNAYIVLTRAAFTATSTTDACGQAFFSGLTSASNYQIAIGKPGYATTTTTNVNISGNTNFSESL